MSKFSTTITVRFDPEIFKEIDERAWAERTTRSELVRAGVQQYLDSLPKIKVEITKTETPTAA